MDIERNLNPKAACLKRREEEKADDGSAKGMQGPPHLGGNGGAGGGGPPPMIPFGSMPPSVSDAFYKLHIVQFTFIISIVVLIHQAPGGPILHV